MIARSIGRSRADQVVGGSHFLPGRTATAQIEDGVPDRSTGTRGARRLVVVGGISVVDATRSNA